MVKRKVFLFSVGLLVFIGLVSTTVAVWAQSGDKRSNESLVSPSQAIHTSAKVENKTVQEVNAFVAQWAATLKNGPGWIHIVNRHDRNKDKAGVLPNGQPIPLDYISDTWYQFDAKNTIIASVAVLRTLDGKPWQTSTFRDGVSRNLTLNERMPSTDSPALLLDFGFSTILAQAASSGRTISRQEQELDGKSIVIYSVQDGPFESTQVQGYAEAIVDGERQVGFDSKTGQVVFLERFVIRANGDRQIAERVDLQTAEKVATPPAQILDLLNTEVMP